jgi:tetratricopeptide (TPR) repeat protein
MPIMNPKLRNFLSVISLAIILVIGILILQHVLSLYYQIKGGQQTQNVLKTFEDLPDLGLTCHAIPAENRDAQTKIEQAILNLNRALAYDSRNSQAYLYLGRAYCLLGKPSNAKENYFIYTQLKPANPLGYLGLGFANELLNKQASAKTAWESAGLTSQDFNEAGDEAYQAKQYQVALRWYMRSLLMEPGKAQSWLSLGRVFDAMSDPEKALDAYQEAWKYDPELSTRELVNALKRQEDFKSIEDVLRQALNGFPKSPERLSWWQELGNSISTQGNWGEAVEVYQAAIREFPEDPELHIASGWAYYERGGGSQLAQIEFEQAIALNDKNAEGYFAIWQLLVREGKLEQAERWFTLGFERSTNNPAWFITVADAAYEENNLFLAQEILKKVIIHFPTYDPAYYKLSRIYLKDNQLDKAVEAIEAALKIMSPPNPWYYLRAGQIYERIGDLNKAVRAYEQALEFDPNNEAARQSIERMESK